MAVICLVQDQEAVIGKKGNYRDRIGEGRFQGTRGRVHSQGKVVVNSSYSKISVSFPIKYILGLTNFNCGSPAWS